MCSRHRRLAAAAIAVFIVVVVAAAVLRKAEPPPQVFRVILGVGDKTQTDWSGQLAVGEGQVTKLEGWRFEDKDTVEGTSGWKCRTRNAISPEHRYPLTPASGKPKGAALQPWPNGVTITLKGDNPIVKLTLAKGEIKFQADDVKLGEPKSYLDGRVRVERLPAVSVPLPVPAKMDGTVAQNDYPAFWVRFKTKKQYLAWLSYLEGKDRVLLMERDGPEGAWSEPIKVDGPGDHFRVALANLHDDTIWVVYSTERDKKWNLFGRPYKDGKLGDEVRVSNGPGPDMWHRMTTDYRGRAWLVWQSFRNGQSDIFARCVDDDGWHDPIQVSESKANDWDPCIAADPKEDRVWVGWDSYDQGHYGVHMRALSGGPKPKAGDILAPEPSPLFQAHVSLACDRAGRLWAAWDESGPEWGKDTGFLYKEHTGTRLYASRNVRVKCLVDGTWREPAQDLVEALPADMKEYNELPQLQDDADGRMWLAFRHRTCREPREDGWAIHGRWDVFATAYLGDHWLEPIELPQSGGRNDMRTASNRDREGNVYFAYASDNRGRQGGMLPRNHSIAISRLDGAPKLGELQWSKKQRELPRDEIVHLKEKEQLARIRGYKVEQGSKTYHIYRGDLHRHTDISLDGVGDGTLMDLHRYALDAAALDYVLVGDHNMGQDNEYCWWRTQKANDLYTVPKAFISMYGYERSVRYPNGHRNVIWVDRGHRTLPILNQPIPANVAADTGRLYDYLRETGGICTLHTSATDQGTNWAEHNDDLEPFVEIFQGYHTSYEAPGAPKTEDETTDLIHGPYKPDGFVSKALDKGYRLGFQASSDHISTHVSYACLLAEDFSRQGLVDAMKKRHSYAATDNIVLDVRMGDHGLMGDEVKTDKPHLDVVVLGTGPIAKVEVIRDGEVLHTETPEKETAEAKFGWEDPKPVKQEKGSYYYVRVQQKDGQMAWASPIWVKKP